MVSGNIDPLLGTEENPITFENVTHFQEWINKFCQCSRCGVVQKCTLYNDFKLGCGQLELICNRCFQARMTQMEQITFANSEFCNLINLDGVH